MLSENEHQKSNTSRHRRKQKSFSVSKFLLTFSLFAGCVLLVFGILFHRQQGESLFPSFSQSTPQRSATQIPLSPDISLTAFVGTFNGEPITLHEFNLVLSTESSQVSTYFQQKYHVLNHPGFWTQSYGNEVPIQMARQLALKQCEHYEATLLFARQAGLVQNISYSHFLQQLAAENRSRQARVQHGQIIYGPVEYAEEFYLYKYMTDLDTLLEQHLGASYSGQIAALEHNAVLVINEPVIALSTL